MIADLLARITSWPPARGQLPALVGLLLPASTLLVAEGGGLLGRFALIGLVMVGWQMLFARVRAQPFGFEGVTAALLVALLVPPTAPAWQLVLGASFGIVIGHLVFGGYGRNLLHPAVVGLAFLMFSFTGEGYREGPTLPVWALLPTAIMLIGSGQANWRILLGTVAGLSGLGWAQGDTDTLMLLRDGIFWLVLLFLAADPVASASTNWGRLGYGLLTGLLIGLFVQAGSAFSAMVFAVLMASIFAPLIDQAVVAINAQRRARRHG